MNMIKKILSYILVFMFVFAYYPGNAFGQTGEKKGGDAEIKLNAGTYVASVVRTAGQATMPNISPRIKLNVMGDQVQITLKVYGVDKLSTLQLYNQDKETLKEHVVLPPSEPWDSFPDMPMTGYGDVIKGYTHQNELTSKKDWEKIEPVKGFVDKVTNTGTVMFMIKDLNKPFTLGGYSEVTAKNGKKFTLLNTVKYKIIPNTIEEAKPLFYAEAGYADAKDLKQYDKLGMERFFLRWYGISKNNFQPFDESTQGLCLSDMGTVKSIDVTGESGKQNIKVTYKLSDKLPENVKSIRILESMKFNEDAGSDPIEKYFLLNDSAEYGENIYDPDKKELVFEYSTDGIKAPLTNGVEVRIDTEETIEKTKNGPHQEECYYTATIFPSTKGWTIRTFKDDKTGVSYSAVGNYVPANASKLDVKSGEDVKESELEILKKITGADPENWRAYQTSLRDKNDNEVNPLGRAGELKIPIPDSWDEEIFMRFFWQIDENNAINMDLDGALEDNVKFIRENGHRYAVITLNNSKWINDAVITMGIPLKESSIDDFNEEGVYKANVKLVKAGAKDSLSMADQTLKSTAYVISKGGEQEVYLDFKPLVLGSTKAYMGHIWNKEPEDTEFLDFEVGEDGKLLDNAGFDAIEEFPCLKAVKMKLHKDTVIVENSFRVKIIPPVMGANNTYDENMAGPESADLKFMGIKKIQDDTDIAYHQKSVLRKSIDKAKRYPEKAYSKDSYDKLAKALKEGEEFYKSLKKDAGKDHKVSAQIKEKSDKIEGAIKNLKDGGELAETRDSLKATIENAKKIEKGKKSDTAFQILQSEIKKAESEAQRTRISIEDLKKAEKALKDAVKTFKTSQDASKLDPKSLADGEYKVYAEMFKPDRKSKSMANEAIKHWITLNVKDGEYKATLDFNGITIQNMFGYLQYLYYYDTGYTYDENGNPGGMENLKPSTVISTQKDKQGNDVIDDYNDKYSPYPKLIEIPIVDKGIESFEPLCVFVPIMESLNPSSGQQNVLLKLDWTTLRNANDTSQDSVNLEDGLYSVKSELRDGKNQKSQFNDEVAKTRLIAHDGKLDVYIDTTENATIKAISIGDTKYEAKDGRIVLTLPENFETTGIKITDKNGKETSGKLYLELKNAKAEEHDKAALEKKVKEAKEIQRENYSEESLANLDNKIAAADGVLSDEVAIKKEISKAGLDLSKAIKDLKEKEDPGSEPDNEPNAEAIKDVYEIKGNIWHAYNKGQKSMADGALAYTKDENGKRSKLPLHIVLKDGKLYLKLVFMPLTQSLEGSSFTGYLGELGYYPEVKSENPPTDESKLEVAEVLTEYKDVFDDFNDPEFGTDEIMKGKLYPKEMLIPIEKDQKNIWLNVYVPVMESIQSGGGRQNARLELDWNSLKKIEDNKDPSEPGGEDPKENPKKEPKLVDSLKLNEAKGYLVEKDDEGNYIFIKDKSKGMILKFEGVDLKDFKELLLNDTPLKDGEDFTKSQGSIILDIKAATLSNLEEGNYTFTLVTKDDLKSTAGVRVKTNADENKPGKTDNDNSSHNNDKNGNHDSKNNDNPGKTDNTNSGQTDINQPEKPGSDVSDAGNKGNGISPKMPPKPGKGNLKKPVRTGDNPMMAGYGMLAVTLAGAMYFVVRRRKDI